MTRIDPRLFPDKSIIDDNSVGDINKGWSSIKLFNMMEAYLERVVGSANAVSPTFQNITGNIDSGLTQVDIEVFPVDGVYSSFDYTKIKFFEGSVDLLTQAPLPPQPVFLKLGAQNFVRVFLPVLDVNKTYNMVFLTGLLYNGPYTNLQYNASLTTNSVYVIPTLGPSVFKPNLNFADINLITVPVTSNHGGRTLSFSDTGISLIGGTSNIESVSYDSINKEINISITAGSMQPNVSYTVLIPSNTLYDGSEGNIAYSNSHSTLPEIQPVFSSITTDSGDTKSFGITKLYLNLSNLEYLNLSVGAGIVNIEQVGGSIVPVSFINELISNNRLVIDLTDPSLDTITDSNNKLFEDTSYNITISEDTVRDGSLSNTVTNLQLVTDNERVPVLGLLNPDTGITSYGMTKINIPITGGPFLYNVTEPQFTLNTSGIRINGITTNINGPISYASDINGQLTGVEIPVTGILPNTVYTVTIPQNSIKDGSQGNIAYSESITTLEEFQPTYNFISSTPANGTANVDFPTFSSVVVKISDLVYSSLRAIDLNLITVNSSEVGLLTILTRSFNSNLKELTLTFSRVFLETEILTFNFPSGVFADGNTLSIESIGEYSFSMRQRVYNTPIFDFISSSPSDNSQDVSESTSQILIPIISTHEIPFSSLTLNPANISVTENGVGDVSSSKVIVGTNLVINVSLTAEKFYEVIMLAGAISDGTSQSAATTTGDLNFDTVTQVSLPTVVRRYSVVLPASVNFILGSNFLTSGTRVSSSFDMSSSGYTDFSPASPVWYYDASFQTLNRRIWLLEVKPSASTFIPSYSGVPANTPRAIPDSSSDSVFALASAGKANGSDFSNNKMLFQGNANPDMYLEFVEFNTEVDINTVQSWANAQDWTVFISI